jgi:hypothetical protein
VFLYKRAQIFVADLYGAFGGSGLGGFGDIGALTMFADYRVPVVLRLLGVLQYGPGLADKVGDAEMQGWLAGGRLAEGAGVVCIHMGVFFSVGRVGEVERLAVVMAASQAPSCRTCSWVHRSVSIPVHV